MSAPTDAQERAIKTLVEHPRTARAEVRPVEGGVREVWCYDKDDVLLLIAAIEPNGNHTTPTGVMLAKRQPHDADWSHVG